MAASQNFSITDSLPLSCTCKTKKAKDVRMWSWACSIVVLFVFSNSARLSTHTCAFGDSWAPLKLSASHSLHSLCRRLPSQSEASRGTEWHRAREREHDWRLHQWINCLPPKSINNCEQTCIVCLCHVRWKSNISSMFSSSVTNSVESKYKANLSAMSREMACPWKCSRRCEHFLRYSSDMVVIVN